MDSLYKRMVLVAESEYFQLKQCSLNASDDKSSLVVWPADVSSEREQKLYALELAKRREKSESDTTKDTDSGTKLSDKTTDFSGQMLLFPASYRARAQRLYNTLDKHRPSHLSWKESGEVSFGPHDSPTEGSNIVDLIQHATTVTRRRNYTPKGWTHFIEVLKRINIPMSYLNKATQDEWNTVSTTTTTTETSSDATTVAAGPSPARRVMRKRKSVPQVHSGSSYATSQSGSGMIRKWIRA